MSPNSVSRLPSRHLSIGSRGEAVRKLETELRSQGLFQGRPDDRFDAATAQAVRRYKVQDHFEHPTGQVHGYLWRKLDLGAGHDGQVADAPNGKTGTFKTVTFNVKSNPVMPQADVVHDVREAARQGSLIGWNEIGPDRYFAAIKALGPDWGHYMPHDGNLRVPNPISWKKSEWKLEDSGLLRTHAGKAGVSPNRYITYVKLQNRQTGQEVVRVNTHLVSGAWNDEKQATDPWRRQMWRLHMDKLDRLVTRLEKQGCPVIIGGDFNRNHFKVLGDRVAYDSGIHQGTHGRATLDYLMHAPDGHLKAVGSRVDRHTRSDHDAVVVRYRLRG